MDLRYNLDERSRLTLASKCYPQKRIRLNLTSKYISPKRTSRKPDPKHILDQRPRLILNPKCTSPKHTSRIFAPKHIPDKCPRLTLTSKHTPSKRTPRIFALKHYPQKRTRQTLTLKCYPNERTRLNLDKKGNCRVRAPELFREFRAASIFAHPMLGRRAFPSFVVCLKWAEVYGLRRGRAA